MKSQNKLKTRFPIGLYCVVIIALATTIIYGIWIKNIGGSRSRLAITVIDSVDIAPTNELDDAIRQKASKASQVKLSKHLTKAIAAASSSSREDSQNQQSVDQTEYDDEAENDQDASYLTFEEQRLEAQFQTEQYIDYMETVLISESSDIEWKNLVQTSIYETLENKNMTELSVNETICGSTICRLNLEIDESMVDESSEIAMDISEIWDGAGFFTMDDRTGELTLYIARKGHVLPQVSDQYDS